MIPIYQIHPIIVHFPIVLLALAFVLDVLIVARGGNLAARATLPDTALWITWMGVVSGVIAIVFGMIASMHAQQAGFPAEPIFKHAGYAQLTALVFLVLAIALSIFRKRNAALAGGRGWVFVVLMLGGVALLVTTGYYGGHLVYELGVNVDVVKP